MKKILLPLLLCTASVQGQQVNSPSLYQHFQQPPPAAIPWVFWYWMQAGVSRAGITADLEAMKAAGIGGAYLMSIKGATNPPLFTPAAEQLTPEWWGMVQFAMKEADRLGLKLGMHVSDGFALAGGPWITPELSMQKVVVSEKIVHGGTLFQDTLPVPESYKGYYKDIAVVAFPAPAGEGINTQTTVPEVTTSLPNTDAAVLVKPGNTKTIGSNDSCWIQYAFKQPFTCRSITITSNGTNYQAHRLIVEVSDDGIHFKRATRLESPRHGWQDGDAPVTHAIPAVTAKYFRFIYSKKGSEPGSEDLDAAKWKPSLKLKEIQLSSAPRLHQYEGKSGAAWRISARTTTAQLTDAAAVPLNKMVALTSFMKNGKLTWKVLAGNWCILRIGHTSTGHTNATGGAGSGLECDKFNRETVALQFDKWFGEALRKAGPLAPRVLNMFHVDSWECGSQNWSPVFRDEFRRRRGYDLLPYLPVMVGIPVESIAKSEQVLYDIRLTISELVKDIFYSTLATLAHANGCSFTAESVAPTMMSDGMLHYSQVDVPMGEFWLNSPTHDKPNDMLDAISGAHIYGKNIIQAEGFTTLRMTWNEHPGMLKTLQDRNYALGVNRLVYHVFMHNPWTDRKPGMTLDGVGLYFQRDQTWWKPGREWVAYASRCQALLQMGKPVVDVAVFTGSELPRRAVLPDRLVSTLPGIMGAGRVQQEKERLANVGEPLRIKPDGVSHSANMADPENWIDPLHGYAYDSFNEDALLNYSTVRNKHMVLKGGAEYGLLVLPVADSRTPGIHLLSPAALRKVEEMERQGLRVIRTPYYGSTFDSVGVIRDVVIQDAHGAAANNIAWTHRKGKDFDIYFIANQDSATRTVEVSARIIGKVPELWNPVTGDTMVAREWYSAGAYTTVPVQLPPNGSLFIVYQQPTSQQQSNAGLNWPLTDTVQHIQGMWRVNFDTASGGPLGPVAMPQLESWTENKVDAIRYYSGTANYEMQFNWQPSEGKSKVMLSLGNVANLAEVAVNGVPCGITWTAPYSVNITRAIRPGENKVTIKVTNTWANRLIGDHALPQQQQRTWTTAPYRLEGKPLQQAGLLGPVTIVQER
ncbi:glycosyl hydrolase [Filimonas lacunae]|nr:glycosyl hydrolase [Filimonas lacunae]